MSGRKVQGARALGVLGGMGPLASAEFLDVLYGFAKSEPEQEAPVVLLYSNPRFADRTSTFLSGDREAEERMLEDLETSLRLLCQPGVEQLVICCVTMHHLYDRLPEDLRQRTRSLVEVALAEVVKRRRRHLMVCTRGTSKLRLFQRHPLWQEAGEWIVWPEEADQDRVHEAIYHVKQHHETAPLVDFLEDLAARYGVGDLIAGCTEIHLAARHLPPLAEPAEEEPRVALLDPLTVIAREWQQGG